jgi:hypothetical protein
VLARELARATAAVGVYLVLRPVWEWTGLKDGYRAIIVGVAERIVVGTQHFPIVASLSNLTTHNLDFVVLLAIGLLLVSAPLGWRRVLKLFGGALVVIVGLQILVFAVWAEIAAAQELERARQILVMSPWEFRVMNQLKLTLYDFGQPAAMFTLFLVTFAWNTGIPLHPEASSKRMRAVVAVALSVTIVTTTGWMAWRRSTELDPRHVEAHAKLGHLFRLAGDNTTAEAQYRIAVASGTADLEVLYDLAEIVRAGGRLDESRRLLHRCAALTTDPVWQSRIERALSR